jgi:hypothetical protein
VSTTHLQDGKEAAQHILVLQQGVEDPLHLTAEDLACGEGVLERALGVGIGRRRLDQVPHLYRTKEEAAAHAGTQAGP